MKTPVPVNVYLQALGGKFLGPNAYDYSQIGVSLKFSRGSFKLNYSVVSGTTNDGVIGTTFAAGSTSFQPILTMPASGVGNPAVNYLSSNNNTVVGSVGIFLPDANEYGLLTASVPTPSGFSVLLQQSILLSPQIVDYRIVMTVPGLLVRRNTAPVSGANLSVFVNMMCGCKVTQGLPTSFWTPSDFVVSAMVYYKNGTNSIYPLTFNAQTNDSLFSGTVPDRANIGRVNFFAQQKSTANYGALTQDF